jgi:hypothetical protein
VGRFGASGHSGRCYSALVGILAATTLAGCGAGPASASRYGTWVWNGSSWTQLTVANEDPAFLGEQLVYAPALGGLISLYQPPDPFTGSLIGGGTKWDGSAWIVNSQGPGRAPYPLLNSTESSQPTAIVWDATHNQLLFLDPNTSTMWVWRNGAWQVVVPPSSWPDARYLGPGGMAYDANRQEVLIFTDIPRELWVWNGQTVATQITSDSAPSIPSHWVSDSLGHLLGFATSDAVSWDGKDWSALSQSAVLPDGAQVASDTTHQQIYAVSVDNSRIWRWDDGTWQLLHTRSSPPAGATSNLIYDPMVPGFVLTVQPQEGIANLP